MAAFGPDGFAFEKLNQQFGARNRDGLLDGREQMHLNASRLVIDAGNVLEVAEIKIGIELAIDASQQVEVKRGGDAELIVIGSDQLRVGLHEICTQQHRIPGNEDVANFAQKVHSSGTIKIADRAAQEQNQKMLAVAALRGNFEEAIEVFALEAQNADGINVA